MHDIRFIRENPEQFDEKLKTRGLAPIADRILQLDKQHRQILTDLQTYQSQRNTIAKAFGDAKRKGEPTDTIALESEKIKQHISVLEDTAREEEQKLFDILAGIPNLPADDVPTGLNEEANKEVLKWGAPKTFTFTPKQHYELGEALGLMDFEVATKLSGARFVLLKGSLSRLERALAQFMLDVHCNEFGYTEITPPLLVNDAAMFGTGNLPKFGDDAFQTNHKHWLIPTSEVCLTNIVAEDILPHQSLPTRFTAYTPCFRAEAGAAGRDTRGMIRNHQFTKVELVSITSPEQSEMEHERMTSAAESILQKLDLPYRKMLLCSGDMGFSARKTYDLEVWLPGPQAYREISSCSNCGDFQARRMNARYRNEQGKPQFVHTLNGSGLAVGRTLIAVLENYQEADGSIKIPEILQKYTGFSRIGN
ncbi:MAG: serine--tRNA ligase [Pseudomonadota bacterium]|jgi:seryl-tRNA synthetase|nr:serine--tRNA ligase [Alphaproteobacteria bacterium]